MNSHAPRPSTRASHSIADINTVLRSCGIGNISQHELAMVGSEIDLVRFNTTLSAISGPKCMTRDRAIQFMRAIIEKARVAIAGGAAVPASPWPDLSSKTVELSSLRDVNATLKSIGLPSLRPEHVEPLLRNYGRTEILRLMNLAVAGGETGDHATMTLRSMVSETMSAAAGNGSASAATQPTAQVRTLPVAARSAADEIPAEVDGERGDDAHGARSQPASRGQAQNASRSDAGEHAHAIARRDPSSHERRATAQTADGRADTSARSAQDRVQCKAYGSRAAITVETDETEAGIPTVRFEFAPVLGNGDSNHSDDGSADKPSKAYDWSKKLIIQLTADEVPQLLAVLYGFAPGAQFSNHGQSKVKWMSLENQEKSIYMRAGDKDVPILVIPVSSPNSIMQIANIAMLVARKRYSALTGDDIRLLVKNQVAQRTKPVQQNRSGAR
jgi:hypothetical protein